MINEKAQFILKVFKDCARQIFEQLVSEYNRAFCNNLHGQVM